MNGVGYFSNAAVGTGLSVNSMFDGKCHHVAVKRILSTLFFYIDGIFISSSATGGNINITSNYYLRVGMDNNLTASSALRGIVDYVRIWNFAKRDQDIFDEIISCNFYTSGLLANWSFEQVPANVILDASGLFHNGLIIPSHGTPVNYGPRFTNSVCDVEECDYITLEPASDPACTQSTNNLYCSNVNLICNGDFEQSNLPPPNPNPVCFFAPNQFGGCTLNGSSNEVMNWCVIAGSPQYFERNTTLISYDIPQNLITNSSTCPTVDTWSGAANSNNHYAVLSDGFGNTDAIGTELTSPLLPNTSYTLRFRSLRADDPLQPPPLPTALKFEIWQSNNNQSGGIGIGSVFINNNCNWNLFSISFTTPNNAIALPYFVVKIQGTQGGAAYLYHIFVDDFEIVQNTSDYPKWMTGTGSQRPSEITTDANDNVYFVGFANQEITYPNGLVQGILNTTTGFVASYDACGNVRWANNSNTNTIKYKATAFDNTNNILYVASQTSTGLQIESYNPVNGNLLASFPVPGSFFNDDIVSAKVDWTGQNWYILFQSYATGEYYFVRYNFLASAFVVSMVVNPLLTNIVDFSINSISGNPDMVYLLGNDLSNSYFRDYNISTKTPSSTNLISSTGVNINFRLTSIDQNNLGILCIGGYYYDCGLMIGANTIVPNVSLFSSAFTFLFNSITNTFVLNSGKYIGAGGASRITKIIADAQGDFIASGIINTVNSTTNYSSTFQANSNSGGLFYTKLSGITGNDIWLKQGTTTSIGTWQKDIAIGNNGTIYGLGYLLGTIDFLQGDTWASGAQCDNTYVLKIMDTGTSASIERLGNNLVAPSSQMQNIKKGFLIHDAFELEILLENYEFTKIEIIDLTGRNIIRQQGTSSKWNIWDALSNGCYYLNGYTESQKTTLFICK